MKVVVAMRYIARMPGRGLFQTLKQNVAVFERRDRAKTKRLSKLKDSVEQMRGRLKRDLRSSDPDKFLTALAVSMLDETAIDPVAARKKHVLFGEDEDVNSVMFKVNRSSKAMIASPHVVQALRSAYERIDADDDELFRHDTGQVTAEAVGNYLAKFGLTSEMLRGYNSNQILQTCLANLRAKGGALPRHWRSKEKVLRSEFDKALKMTANVVGLDEPTLRSEYLAPGLEAAYRKDGTFGMRESSLQAVQVWLRYAASDP